MTDLDRLSAVSRMLGWVCLGLMVFLPLGVVAGWLSFDTWGSSMTTRLGLSREIPMPDTLRPEQIILGIVVTMAPVGHWCLGFGIYANF